MIELYGVKVRRGKRIILKNVSFEVEKGEVVILLGENGAGKTTLIRTIAGLEKWEGEIYIDGFIPGEGGEEKISLLGQYFDPFGDLKVRELFSILSLIREDILSQLGIYPLMDKRIKELSGGEKRRVGIAFAFMQRKDYIILDEPTSSIDISYMYKLLKIIDSEKTLSKGFLIATHDIIFAREIGDRFVFLREGKVAYITTREGFFFACMDVFGSNPYTEVMKRYE